VAQPVVYRFLRPGEEAAVCELVERVFDEFVAPDFGEEGIAEFLRYAEPRALAERCAADAFVLVAADGDDLAGMIEVINFDHLAMLFVSRRGRGIAAELIGRAVEICRRRKPGLSRLTVHASLFARPIYGKLGFEAPGATCTESGITYVPMALDLEPGD
jgi:GNAT superfamily N-acetyltransferase